MTTNLYTVHTSATPEQMAEFSVWLAEKTMNMAMINEVPNGYAVMAPARQVHVWTAGRWLAAIGVLAASPFVFRAFPSLTPLQAFGIGWITAAIVLLLGRNSTRPMQ